MRISSWTGAWHGDEAAARQLAEEALEHANRSGDELAISEALASRVHGTSDFAAAARYAPAAIRQLYQQPAVVKPRARKAVASAGCPVVLGGGTGGLVAARELQRRIPAGHRVVPFGPTDVAEPVRVFVLDHSGADQLRAVLAEPAKRLVDVVHSEHDA